MIGKQSAPLSGSSGKTADIDSDWGGSAHVDSHPILETQRHTIHGPLWRPCKIEVRASTWNMMTHVQPTEVEKGVEHTSVLGG